MRTVSICESRWYHHMIRLNRVWYDPKATRRRYLTANYEIHFRPHSFLLPCKACILKNKTSPDTLEGVQGDTSDLHFSKSSLGQRDSDKILRRMLGVSLDWVVARRKYRRLSSVINIPLPVRYVYRSTNLGIYVVGDVWREDGQRYRSRVML